MLNHGDIFIMRSSWPHRFSRHSYNDSPANLHPLWTRMEFLKRRYTDKKHQSLSLKKIPFSTVVATGCKRLIFNFYCLIFFGRWPVLLLLLWNLDLELEFVV